MRIVIDARELCGRPTGVGRYLAGLLDAWHAAGFTARHQFTLIAHHAIAGADRWRVSTRIVDGNGGTAWEQTSLKTAAKAEQPDVFFAPGYTAPLMMAVPLVLTIHDVSYFAHPEWFSFREGLRRRILTKRAARQARRVITDTEFSKSEIARHLGVDATVIPLGIDGSDVRSDVRSPIVLYVGSLFQRRRIDRLIAAFDQAAGRLPGARLEIVGENRTRPHIDFDALRRNATHADRIHMRSYVDETTLQQLYSQASVFAFLSEYEGFGLTPLEALAKGVTPLLLDTAVARETCGDAARYVSASAGNDELAAAMIDLLSNASHRDALLRQGAQVLARFNWNEAADATLAVIEEAARAR